MYRLNIVSKLVTDGMFGMIITMTYFVSQINILELFRTIQEMIPRNNTPSIQIQSDNFAELKVKAILVRGVVTD